MRLALNDLFWATSGYEWTSHLRFEVRSHVVVRPSMCPLSQGQEWRKPSNYCDWYGTTCDEFGVAPCLTAVFSLDASCRCYARCTSLPTTSLVPSRRRLELSPHLPSSS